jgi:hypothetical protein
MGEGTGLWSCPRADCVWGGYGRDKTTKTSTRSGKRPVKDDGQRHSTGMGGLWGRGRNVAGAGHIRDTYLCNPRRTV